MSLKPAQIMTGPLTGPLAPTFEDPIGVLKACHGRIEQRLQMLERACEIFHHGDEKRRMEAAQALVPVVGYFTTGGVKHTQDEEISLFPRLRQSLAGGHEVIAVMCSLEAQHREGEKSVAKLEEVVAALLHEPREFNGDDIEQLEEITCQMTTHYRPHIKLEDEILFPCALETLSQAEIAAIGEEMADRRGVKVVPPF